jgi:hypothetical protein
MDIFSPRKTTYPHDSTRVIPRPPAPEGGGGWGSRYRARHRPRRPAPARHSPRSTPQRTQMRPQRRHPRPRRKGRRETALGTSRHYIQSRFTPAHNSRVDARPRQLFHPDASTTTPRVEADPPASEPCSQTALAACRFTSFGDRPGAGASFPCVRTWNSVRSTATPEHERPKRANSQPAPQAPLPGRQVPPQAPLPRRASPRRHGWQIA